MQFFLWTILTLILSDLFEASGFVYCSILSELSCDGSGNCRLDSNSAILSSVGGGGSGNSILDSNSEILTSGGGGGSGNWNKR